MIIIAVEAKRTSQNCILQQVALTKAEIETAECHKDLLTEICMENEGDLAVAEKQLSLLMHIVDDHDILDVEDDVAFYHVVYVCR